MLGFDYFDVGISIYLWYHSLMLVVGTASIILTDGTKQVQVGGSYQSKLYPVAILLPIRDFR